MADFQVTRLPSGDFETSAAPDAAGYYVMVDDDTTVDFCQTLEGAKRVGAAKRDAEPLKARFSIVAASTGDEVADLGWSR